MRRHNPIMLMLAVYRIAFMIAAERGFADSAERLRSWVYHRYGGDSWQFAGITCPLCSSFWLALVFWFLPNWMIKWLGSAGGVLVGHRVLEALHARRQS